MQRSLRTVDHSMESRRADNGDTTRKQEYKQKH